MCGIYGYNLKAGVKLTQREFSMLHGIMGVAMESRGNESFGVATVTVDGVVHVVKRDCSITEGAASVLNGVARDATTVFTHTRYATTGKVTAANAHPFRINGIVGCHNGIIHNHRELNRLFNRNCEVDSQHIFLSIATESPLSFLEGYGAVVYVRENDATRTVRLARFNGGELRAVRLQRGEKVIGVAWCSELAPLMNAAAMAGFTAVRVKVQEGVWHTAVDGELYITGELVTIERTRVAVKPVQAVKGAAVGVAAVNSGKAGDKQSSWEWGGVVREGVVWPDSDASDRYGRKRRGRVEVVERSSDGYGRGEQFSEWDCDECGCLDEAHVITGRGDESYCTDCGSECGHGELIDWMTEDGTGTN